LIWLFLKKFLEDTELACDEQVLANCGEDEKKAYAMALVDCAESMGVFASPFGGAKIRVRIDRILVLQEAVNYFDCKFDGICLLQ